MVKEVCFFFLGSKIPAVLCGAILEHATYSECVDKLNSVKHVAKLQFHYDFFMILYLQKYTKKCANNINFHEELRYNINLQRSLNLLVTLQQSAS
jgi:hypothetical protein